jgi:type II secretory pathway component GspD/PulD (secretin)
VGTKSFALIVTPGEKTVLKQGSKVPIVTGTADKGSSEQSAEVQYQDVGLEIEASLDGVKLSTRVVQSSLADERPGVSAKDPVLRQTVLDLVATLEPGKPLVLGSIDVAGSTRHEEIAVVSEVVQ